MKQIILLLALYFVAGTSYGQNPANNITLPDTLIMPDGAHVPTRSLDSVKKANGWDDIQISLLDDGAHLHPMKSKPEQLESEKHLQNHLNRPAPDFVVRDIYGKQHSLSSLRGKTVVLNFWFTHCGGCITEMPDLNELNKAYSGKDVVFLAISFDEAVKIKAFLPNHPFDYIIVPDARQVCTDYDIYGYPTSVVIDRNGIITFIECSVNSDIKTRLAKAIDQAGNRL